MKKTKYEKIKKEEKLRILFVRNYFLFWFKFKIYAADAVFTFCKGFRFPGGEAIQGLHKGYFLPVSSGSG
jgi:hypothetical protein